VPWTFHRAVDAALDSDHAWRDLVGRLAMPGSGLLAEHVPWLARAGVWQFHVGVQVRPGASYKAYVAAAYVRSWRTLLDARTRP